MSRTTRIRGQGGAGFQGQVVVNQPGGQVAVGLQERAGQVVLTVRDIGIGILEALQTELFEKFSAAAHPGVGGEASTGLGLFITKQIVQLHRGKVWVESQEGAGTCFFVELR